MPDEIWFLKPSVSQANELGVGTMVSHLGIQVVEVGADFMSASMPVDHTTRQPHGILHGGASLALAETVGSIAASFCVDPSLFYCVGVDINANHIRAVKQGLVIATARPHHLGRTTQVWETIIRDEEDRLINVGRLTMAVLKRP